MLHLQAEQRTIKGKHVVQMRKEGKLPAVVYGRGIETESISIPYPDFMRIWKQAGESSLVEIDLGQKKHTVLISDVQLHPVKNTPLHVDFLVVRMDEKIKAPVPIEFTGESPVVKQLGGALVKVMHEVEVEALPADLPNQIMVDISSLAAFEDRITVADMRVHEGVTILANPEDVIALVRQVEEEKAEETKSIEDIEVTTEKKEKEEGESAEETTEEKQKETKEEKKAEKGK